MMVCPKGPLLIRQAIPGFEGLLEQFVVWQYNAYKHGIKEHQLNAPLPRIDRERTA